MFRDHFVYEPSQWETTLQCNVVSHWLGAYTKWCLMLHVENDSMDGCVVTMIYVIWKRSFFILMIWYHDDDMQELCFFQHDDMMIWRWFPHYWPVCEGNPPVTGGLSPQKASNIEIWCLLCCWSLQAVEQTVELLLIGDTVTLMWCRCHGCAQIQSRLQNLVYTLQIWQLN